jgi:hypothetical protein
MGTTRLLLRHELIYKLCIIFIIIFICNGCKENLVKYDSFIEKPSAIKKDDVIEIKLGYTAASANCMKTFVNIEGNIIYIFGELTLKEIPQTISIKLPEPQKNYKVIWIDGDGEKTEIKVRQQNGPRNN